MERAELTLSLISQFTNASFLAPTASFSLQGTMSLYNTLGDFLNVIFTLINIHWFGLHFKKWRSESISFSKSHFMKRFLKLLSKAQPSINCFLLLSSFLLLYHSVGWSTKEPSRIQIRGNYYNNHFSNMTNISYQNRSGLVAKTVVFYSGGQGSNPHRVFLIFLQFSQTLRANCHFGRTSSIEEPFSL